MPVVADIPEIFERALEAFRPHFGAPAFEHFKRYVLGLIVSENLTIEGINRIFIQAKHPSSLNRFLTTGIWKQREVNDTGIDILKIQGALWGKGWLATIPSPIKPARRSKVSASIGITARRDTSWLTTS
jgi:hypothetical protein